MAIFCLQTRLRSLQSFWCKFWELPSTDTFLAKLVILCPKSGIKSRLNKKTFLIHRSLPKFIGWMHSWPRRCVSTSCITKWKINNSTLMRKINSYTNLMMSLEPKSITLTTCKSSSRTFSSSFTFQKRHKFSSPNDSNASYSPQMNPSTKFRVEKSCGL